MTTDQKVGGSSPSWRTKAQQLTKHNGTPDVCPGSRVRHGMVRSVLRQCIFTTVAWVVIPGPNDME